MKSLSLEDLEKLLEETRSERERILSQINMIGQKRSELDQQQNQLGMRMAQLDGEIQGYEKAKSRSSESATPETPKEPTGE